jgi:hypothetical protein
MLFLIMGASGSGKSSVLSGLRKQRADIDWRDFDDAPKHPANSADRQQTTEYWLGIVIQNQAKGVSTGIAGTTVFGEVLACPSAPLIDGIHAILLDCADVVRIDRIRARDGLNAQHASQEMLCWAAWLRMHASDPQWRQDVIQKPGAQEMEWSRWSSWEKDDARWKVDVLDNTSLGVAETTSALTAWLEGKSRSDRNEAAMS